MSQNFSYNCAQLGELAQQDIFLSQQQFTPNISSSDKIKRLIQDVIGPGCKPKSYELLVITNLHKEEQPQLTTQKEFDRFKGDDCIAYYADFVFNHETGSKITIVVTFCSEYRYTGDTKNDTPCSYAGLLRLALKDMKALEHYLRPEHRSECEKQIYKIQSELKVLLFDLEQEMKKIREALEE